MENGNQTKRQVGMEQLKEIFSLLSRSSRLPFVSRSAKNCSTRSKISHRVATPFFVSLFCFGLSRRQKGPRSIRVLATGCWWRWWWQNLPGNGAGTADGQGGCDDGFVLRYIFNFYKHLMWQCQVRDGSWIEWFPSFDDYTFRGHMEGS